MLSLEGKFQEAQAIEQRDMSPEAAAANVTAIRQMIAQNNSWREIETMDAKKRGVKPRKDPSGAGPGPAPMQLGPGGQG